MVQVSAKLKEIGTYNSDVKIVTDVYMDSSMIIAVVNSSGTVNGHIGYLGVNWANCDASFILPTVTNGNGNELIIKVAKIKAQMSSNGSEGLNQSRSANLSTTVYQLVQ